MSRRTITLAIASVAALAVAGVILTRALERVMRTPVDLAPASDTAPAERAPAPVRHITATLFYGSRDGQYLVPVKREVPFGEGPEEQGRQIVLAQLTMPAAAPHVPAVPAGGTLRSFYVSGRGEAFVDLGPEIVAAHPGGSAAELLTVYAIVNAVTANLPAITRVQILVAGQEVDTLAGHIDLRRPLQRNDTLVREEKP